MGGPDARDRLKPVLLFKEIFEGLAGVVGTRRSRRRRTIRRRLSVRSGSSVLFNSHSKFVEGAVIASIFRGDALGNGLHAFELRAGIEETALLAAVEFEVAFGAGTVGVEAGGENSAAIGTSGAGNGADHARGARAELIGASRTARWGLLLVRSLALLRFFGVAIAAVTILSIHKYLRPPAATDCNRNNTDFCARSACLLGLYPIGLLHSAGRKNIPKRLTAEMGTSESRRWDLYVFSAMGVRSQAGLSRTVPESLWPTGRLGQAVSKRSELPGDSLLRDASREAVYLTLDFWNSRRDTNSLWRPMLLTTRS